MNRNQLAILSAASATAAVAWGAVFVQGSSDRADEDAAASSVSSTSALSAPFAPETPRSTVPPDLGVPTIEPGGSGTPRGGGAVRDVANSPSAVGAAFVRTMWTYDTATDTTSHDAAARAVRWATERLASTLALPATRTTPQWDEWLRRGAYTRVGTAGVPSLGQDVETAERLRTYRVDVLAVGADGYLDQLQPFLVTCTLVREDGLWLVDRITLT